MRADPLFAEFENYVKNWPTITDQVTLAVRGRGIVQPPARQDRMGPRLQSSSVLLDAIRGGLALLTWEQDAFAYAES